MSEELITVEVVYASIDKQKLVSVHVSEGTTVKETIIISGIQKDFPEIDLSQNSIGIYGKRTTVDTLVQHKDRIEIYRRLVANPKDVRRKRAADKIKKES